MAKPPRRSSERSGSTDDTSTLGWNEQDRQRWEQEMVEDYGQEWVDRHRELIDAQWEYIQSL
jgi:hypothetical protein